MGSTSDWGVMKAATETLAQFGVESETKVLSAHRTPAELEKWVSGLRERDFAAVIAAAGGAAHLAGVVAAFTTLPVIAVPIKGKTLDGLDSLLSMVQMPSGIPVALWLSTVQRMPHSSPSRCSPSPTHLSKRKWTSSVANRLRKFSHQH